MRKLIFSALLVCFCATMVFAQVPEKTRVTFKEKYPDVTMVKWYPERDNYRAVFVDKNNVDNVVIIDREGKIIRREMAADRDVPKTVGEYYVKQFPNEKNYRVFVSIDESGNRTYYIPGKDRVYYFDKEGAFTREERQEMREEIRDMEKK